MRSILAAIALFATGAAYAQEGQFSVVKRAVGESGLMWIVVVTSRSDHLDIHGVDFNRGNCRSNLLHGHDFPNPMRFGDQVAMTMTDCDPVEMRIKTDDGISTIEMPE